MNDERLSNRQIFTLKQLVICTANGRPATLTRDQREAMVPLWRRGLVEMWFKHVPDAPTSRGPYFSLTDRGTALTLAILASADRFKVAA